MSFDKLPVGAFFKRVDAVGRPQVKVYQKLSVSSYGDANGRLRRMSGVFAKDEPVSPLMEGDRIVVMPIGPAA